MTCSLTRKVIVSYTDFQVEQLISVTENITSSHHPIMVSGAAMVTAAGNDLSVILTSVENNKAVLPTKVHFYSKTSPLYKKSPVVYCVPTVNGKNGAARAAELLSQALSNILDKLPSSIDARKVMIYIIIPSVDEFRSEYIYPDNLWDAIDAVGERVKFMPRCFGERHLGSVEHLLAAQDALLQKEVDAVLLGGLDSFVDRECLLHQFNHHNLPLTEEDGHDVPAEAASFLILQRCEDANPKVVISGLASGYHPPDVTMQQDARLQSSLLWETLDEAGANREEVNSVFHSGSSTADAIATWQIVSKEIWPQKSALQVISRDQPIYKPANPLKRPKVFKVARVLGNLGAATLPSLLGLAFQSLKTQHSQNLDLVIDALDPHTRGVVAVKLLNENEKDLPDV